MTGVSPAFSHFRVYFQIWYLARMYVAQPGPMDHPRFEPPPSTLQSSFLRVLLDVSRRFATLCGSSRFPAIVQVSSIGPEVSNPGHQQPTHPTATLPPSHRWSSKPGAQPFILEPTARGLLGFRCGMQASAVLLQILPPAASSGPVCVHPSPQCRPFVPRPLPFDSSRQDLSDEPFPRLVRWELVPEPVLHAKTRPRGRVPRRLGHS